MQKYFKTEIWFLTRVSGGEGRLSQAHFGLYASAAINEGIVYNDELTIREIADENAAMLYILSVP